MHSDSISDIQKTVGLRESGDVMKAGDKDDLEDEFI